MSEDPRPDETAAPSVDQEAAEFVPSKFQRSRGRFVERTVVVQGLMAKLRELVTSTSKKMIARRQWSRDELRHAARFSAAELQILANVQPDFFEVLGIELSNG